jgi:DNA-binding Lrp family transcriptional regulator
MCEMLIRYRIIGAITDDSLPFPLTQEELADATGMTPVHANRMIRQLRAEGLIDLKGKILTILDPQRLLHLANYDSAYLHLIRTERRDPIVSGRAADLVEPSEQGAFHNKGQS